MNAYKISLKNKTVVKVEGDLRIGKPDDPADGVLEGDIVVERDGRVVAVYHREDINGYQEMFPSESEDD